MASFYKEDRPQARSISFEVLSNRPDIGVSLPGTVSVPTQWKKRDRSGRACGKFHCPDRPAYNKINLFPATLRYL